MNRLFILLSYHLYMLYFYLNEMHNILCCSEVEPYTLSVFTMTILLINCQLSNIPLMECGYKHQKVVKDPQIIEIVNEVVQILPIEHKVGDYID
jgi:hypothetical protein